MNKGIIVMIAMNMIETNVIIRIVVGLLLLTTAETTTMMSVTATEDVNRIHPITAPMITIIVIALVADITIAADYHQVKPLTVHQQAPLRLLRLGEMLLKPDGVKTWIPMLIMKAMRAIAR
jgi:hypothetical protein